MIETLIASGHRFNEIGDYTPNQLALFYRYAIKRTHQGRIARTMDTAYALSGGKELSEYIKVLNHD